MELDHEREIAIERRVQRRWQRRLLLMLDFALFITYLSILGASGDIAQSFRQLGMAWMVMVFVHTVWFIYTEWLERAVRGALEQERNAYYRAVAATVLTDEADEKPKRDHRLSRTDEGKFEDEIEFDEREYRKRR